MYLHQVSRSYLFIRIIRLNNIHSNDHRRCRSNEDQFQDIDPTLLSLPFLSMIIKSERKKLTFSNEIDLRKEKKTNLIKVKWSISSICQWILSDVRFYDLSIDRIVHEEFHWFLISRKKNTSDKFFFRLKDVNNIDIILEEFLFIYLLWLSNTCWDEK